MTLGSVMTSKTPKAQPMQDIIDEGDFPVTKTFCSEKDSQENEKP